MGMVYRGLDEALEREVAVKTLTVEGTLDEESRQRFEIEAQGGGPLQHPNIVTVFELGEDRGMPFIAMELLPGAGPRDPACAPGETLLLEEKLEIVIQVLPRARLSPTSTGSCTATSSPATSACSTTAPRRSWTSASPSSGARTSRRRA